MDKVLLVPSDLLLQIHQRLKEILGTTEEKLFEEFSSTLCGDLYQLSPVQGHPVYGTK